MIAVMELAYTGRGARRFCAYDEKTGTLNGRFAHADSPEAARKAFSDKYGVSDARPA